MEPDVLVQRQLHPYFSRCSNPETPSRRTWQVANPEHHQLESQRYPSYNHVSCPPVNPRNQDVPVCRYRRRPEETFDLAWMRSLQDLESRHLNPDARGCWAQIQISASICRSQETRTAVVLFPTPDH
ncbi:unnamed protein product [Macrosiphum euphorbiae]|uniref:Uncharacterized protein n=1 Tax=Macrosiphum euphorbiae TaxID=13131 RepID=A0AAV0VQY8_9HEMI|nr:unnamed protein product [Macrosiphum euphorbiae]